MGNNPINRFDPTGHAEFLRNVNIYVDGASAGQVMLYSDWRTYFSYPDEPVRAHYESMGYTVTWDGSAVWAYSPSGGGGDNGGGYEPPPEPTPEERRAEFNQAAGSVPQNVVDRSGHIAVCAVAIAEAPYVYAGAVSIGSLIAPIVIYLGEELIAQTKRDWEITKSVINVLVQAADSIYHAKRDTKATRKVTENMSDTQREHFYNEVHEYKRQKGMRPKDNLPYPVLERI